MRDKKFYLTILLVFFCCFLVKAQSGEEVYVYKDSDINIEHSAEKLLPVTAQAVNEPDVDTIKINSYGIINDSAEVLKKSPDFAYAKNLDSDVIRIIALAQTGIPLLLFLSNVLLIKFVT